MILFLFEGFPVILTSNYKFSMCFCCRMSVTINNEKKKIMMIKSKNITDDNLLYDNNNLEHVSSYKYLKIDSRHKLNWTYNIEKMINGGSGAYYEI